MRISHIGTGCRSCGIKLSGNGAITVAFLGGSFTEVFGSSDIEASCWRALIESDLQMRFKGRQVTCINVGVGGTDSSLGVNRLKAHVLYKGEIDEFSMNDGQHREESIRGMEGIVPPMSPAIAPY